MNVKTAPAGVNDERRQDSILARLMAEAVTADAGLADDLTEICRTIIDANQVPAARIFAHLIDLAAAGYREVSTRRMSDDALAALVDTIGALTSNPDLLGDYVPELMDAIRCRAAGRSAAVPEGVEVLIEGAVVVASVWVQSAALANGEADATTGTYDRLGEIALTLP